ncbi:cAMP-specific 3',5'-cyclic phosphodiesterase [Thraustotheca clavata]|uniref:Phosphodiesterase n=1 Tax=Thraustotheca clavata TaxID=74557 RepID=A0A1W0A467_9STRA|nr:cAMP-specific 3',5'-cyclic phosphodiesterase [Thraustotheca clavata]
MLMEHKVTRVVPSVDSLSDTTTRMPKSVDPVHFHPLTARFVGNPKLEKLYLEKAVKEWSPRSFKIVLAFLLLYFIFVAPNLTNLTSSDASIRQQSQEYFLYVVPSMLPIPFLLWIARLERFQKYYHKIYAMIILCWTCSIIGGGMHSMLREWSVYIQDDMSTLLQAAQVFNLTATYTLSTQSGVWPYKTMEGTGKDILFQFMGDILLPAATMNINLLRMILISVFVPLLRIDTPHAATVSLISSMSYAVLTLVIYPHTSNQYFITNEILVCCFPLLFSIVLFLQNRDMERMYRQEFLHMHEIEEEAEFAYKQREAIAEENKNLKNELKLAKQHEATITKPLAGTIDLESPIHKIISDLKSLQDELKFTDTHSAKMTAIVTALSKLDTNLFTPDIIAQMRSSNGVDVDTKNWAISVLGKKEYNPMNRIPPLNNDARSKSSNHVLVSDQGAILLPHMPLIELTTIQKIQARIATDGWNLDVLGLDCKGHPVLFVGIAVFEYHRFYDHVKVDPIALKNFLLSIDEGYLRNPYHNAFHAADVINSVNYLISSLNNGYIRNLLTEHEFFAALIAAAVHDFRHPGRSNNFIIKARDRLALQYSDKSVLENMHLAESFMLAQENPNCDIWAHMKDKNYREMRKAIIEMVLSTDLSMHLQLVGSLKALILSDEKHDIANDPLIIMKAKMRIVVVKCADIGHSAKTVRLHGLWSSMIIEEFFIQGDAERDAATDISPFMDRWAENSAKNQIGFFEFIVLPFFDTVSKVVFPDAFRPIQQATKRNYALWKEASRRNLTTIQSIRDSLFSDDNIQIAELTN